jgi:acetyl esterase/lipase
VHGGAWTSNDRTTNQAIDQGLAASGVVVAALDFRMAPKFPYPASVSDVNYGIRWLKANAAKFNTQADWVGILGTSSGGHQMLVNVLQPDHPRHATNTELGNAEVAYAVACWPIADPLARYHMAKERNNARLVSAHHEFFGTEDTMRDSNPQLILERGEKVRVPPLLILQGTKDDNVTPDMAQKFVAAYRKAGGRAVLEEFDGQPHTFITKEPASTASLRAIELMRSFVLQRGATA